MKGHPASGKSTLAGALSARLRWPLIDKDDIKDWTAELPDGNTLAYTIMWAVVRRQLELGLSVIVDSPLSYSIGYATGQELAAQTGAHLLVIEVTLDEMTWRTRLEKRDETESSHKISGWHAMQALLQSYAGCWQYPISPEHLLQLDGSQPLDQLREAVQARLSCPPAACSAPALIQPRSTSPLSR